MFIITLCGCDDGEVNKLTPYRYEFTVNNTTIPVTIYSKTNSYVISEKTEGEHKIIIIEDTITKRLYQIKPKLISNKR